MDPWAGTLGTNLDLLWTRTLRRTIHSATSTYLWTKMCGQPNLLLLQFQWAKIQFPVLEYPQAPERTRLTGFDDARTWFGASTVADTRPPG